MYLSRRRVITESREETSRQELLNKRLRARGSYRYYGTTFAMTPGDESLSRLATCLPEKRVTASLRSVKLAVASNAEGDTLVVAEAA